MLDAIPDILSVICVLFTLLIVSAVVIGVTCWVVDSFFSRPQRSPKLISRRTRGAA